MSSRSRHARKAAAAAVRSAATPPAEVDCPATAPCLEELVACHEGPFPSHEEIAERAREIWEARGQPDGQDLDIWLAAEGQLISRTI